MLKRDRDFFCIADNMLSAFDDERADGLLHEFLEAVLPDPGPLGARLSGAWGEYVRAEASGPGTGTPPPA